MISEWFWWDRLWLPLNVTWADLQDKDGRVYAHVSHLYIILPVAVLLLGLRVLYERLIAQLIAAALGVKDKVRTKALYNQTLEQHYRTHSKHPSQADVRGLSKKVSWSERRVENWFRRRRNQDRPGVLKKFREASWRFVFYLCAFLGGILALYDKPWFYDLREVWAGFPKQRRWTKLAQKGFLMTQQLEISAGYVFPLECNSYASKVRWNDLDSPPAGIEIRNKTLWFFPAQPSHSGNYSCTCWSNIREGEWNVTYSISVLNKTCSPGPIDSVGFLSGTSRSLYCEADHITEVRQLYPNSQVTLMKDCKPLSCLNCERYRFSSVKQSDQGHYTCLVNFTHNGIWYTAAHTTKVEVTHVSDPQKPRLIYPKQEEYSVQVGSRHELNCRAFVGTDEEDKVDRNMLYWLWHNSIVEDSEHFVSDSSCISKDRTWYCDSRLTISSIKPEFLGIPFVCVILNSKGTDNGTVVLIPADQSHLYCGLGLAVTFTVVFLCLVLFCFFKVDLVLAYRKFNPCLNVRSDGKVYDAYVSYLHVDDQCMTFALCNLPEVLEDRLGYRLFIRGRDDLPGEAVPDVISKKIGQSRRLVLILTSQTFTKPANDTKLRLLHENLSLNNNKTETYPCLLGSADPNWGPYESRVGLYDALVKEGLRVILVQLGADVDEAHLPESLRYIRRTQGSLRWKPHYATKPSGKFWKQLHYRMPPVQKNSLSTVV